MDIPAARRNAQFIRLKGSFAKVIKLHSLLFSLLTMVFRV